MLEPMRLFLLLVGGFPELVTRVLGAPTDDLAKELEVHVLESQRVLRSDALERAVYKDIPQAAGVDNPMMLGAALVRARRSGDRRPFTDRHRPTAGHPAAHVRPVPEALACSPSTPSCLQSVPKPIRPCSPASACPAESTAPPDELVGFVYVVRESGA